METARMNPVAWIWRIHPPQLPWHSCPVFPRCFMKFAIFSLHCSCMFMHVYACLCMFPVHLAEFHRKSFASNVILGVIIIHQKQTPSLIDHTAARLCRGRRVAHWRRRWRLEPADALSGWAIFHGKFPCLIGKSSANEPRVPWQSLKLPDGIYPFGPHDITIVLYHHYILLSHHAFLLKSTFSPMKSLKKRLTSHTCLHLPHHTTILSPLHPIESIFVLITITLPPQKENISKNSWVPLSHYAYLSHYLPVT